MIPEHNGVQNEEVCEKKNDRINCQQQERGMQMSQSRYHAKKHFESLTRLTRMAALRVLCCLFVLTLSSTALADRFNHLALDQMIDRSVVVAIITVTDINEDAYDEIVGPQTEIAADVVDVLKGIIDAREIVFRVRGGMYPNSDVKLTISGTPFFAAGETYIVFMEKHDDYMYHPFLETEESVLRIDKSMGREIVINRNGRFINTSKSMGFVKGDIVSKTDSQIGMQQALYRTSDSENILIQNDEVLRKAQDAAQVVSYIKNRCDAKKTGNYRKIVVGGNVQATDLSGPREDYMEEN
jgi:hypothetical protein